MSDYERWNQPKQVKKKMHLLASELRERSTKSEEILWDALRNRKLGGRKFRRQVPVGAFVVDFYCAKEQLVLEIDGSIHDHQQAADHLRQEAIETLGIRVLRLSTADVEGNLSETLQTIQSYFNSEPTRT